MLQFDHRQWKYKKNGVHWSHGEDETKKYFPSQYILGFMVKKGTTSDYDQTMVVKFSDSKISVSGFYVVWWKWVHACTAWNIMDVW